MGNITIFQIHYDKDEAMLFCTIFKELTSIKKEKKYQKKLKKCINEIKEDRKKVIN